MNKIITLILIALITAAAVAATDLADYPDFFVDNGKFNGIIVIGENAPAEDVISAIDISSAFPVKVGASYLDSEIKDVTDYNAIVIGNPCINSAAAELEGQKGSSCDKWLEEGKGYIKLYKHGNRVQVLVTGLDSSDRRAAAHVLARYNEFDLEGFAMEVDGWQRAPKKYSDHTPYDSSDSDNDYSWFSGAGDLDDYPGFLLDDGYFDGYIVVGSNAPGSDVIAAIDIMTGLAQTKYNGEYPEIQNHMSRLDSEIPDITRVNAIIVGHPDTNTAARALDNGSGLEAGKGYIKVFKHGSKYQVLVTGLTEFDRRKAARVLAQYNKHDLDGSVIEVQGTSLTDVTAVEIAQTAKQMVAEYNAYQAESLEMQNSAVQEYTYKEPEQKVELIIYNPAPKITQEPEQKTGIIDSMWETIFGWI